jgi:glycosyltransferase involved in cell wall biosynthesis
MENYLNKINEEGVSVVMGARNEFPQVAMTICSIMEDFYDAGIEKWEIILMDNGSEDETSRFFGWKPSSKLGTQWSYDKAPRGIVSEDRLRIFYDPILSNVGTRNKGARHAKYENIIFADAHIILRRGTILSVVSNLIKYGGIIHAPISWMGSSCYNPRAGYQYSYKVGEKIWGTWNFLKVADTAFYIPICGHAFLAVRRKQFLKYRGYPEAQRVYGGGEPYLDTKYWMLGSTSMMDPQALVYHLSAGRGYSWHNHDLIHNMFLVSYILGGEPWSDRILITYLNKPQAHNGIIKMLHEQALRGGEEDKRWLDAKKTRTFEEVLALRKPHDCDKCMKRGYSEPHSMRPWDTLNEKLHGYHRSYVQEFPLHRRDNGIYIGNSHITDHEAIEIAEKHLK